MHRALTDQIQQLQDERARSGDVAAALKQKLASELSNHEDIFEYLRAEIHKKNGEVNELKEQKLKLLEVQEQLVLDQEKALQDAQDARMKDRTVLEQEVGVLKAQLKRIEAFIQKEQELTTELADKKRQLEETSKEYAMGISDLERKHVQEKDRLKREMLSKLRETKANLLRMTDNQLDTTTKRTMAENEQMSCELAWQAKETEKLIRKNNTLEGEIQTLRRNLALHKETEQGFAKKVNVYQKTIKTLLAKLNALDASQQAELQRIHVESDERERERAEQLREWETLESERAEWQASLTAANEEIARLRISLHEAQTKHTDVMALQDEAVRFTLQCLQDFRGVQDFRASSLAVAASVHTVAEGTNETTAPGPEQVSLHTLDPSHRESVLTYLLEQLRAYQHQLKELELQNAWKQHGVDAVLNDSPASDTRSRSLIQTGAAAAAASAVRLPPIVTAPPPLHMHDEAKGVTQAVGGSLRPWGKRMPDKGRSTRHN